ncbi:hypothetical protein WJX81_002996 [Elliptochloris bilobata]|uniref:Uncharacterized protein n=1 Tax=Elliptochloris bilobata TaxID=381761 RepID=A0AAW1RD95_9CHLO
MVAAQGVRKPSAAAAPQLGCQLSRRAPDGFLANTTLASGRARADERVAPTGVAISAAALNVIPALLSITPIGVSIAPQGVNIQPSIMYISPSGVNVAPEGFNVQPQLIAVTPVDYSDVPQGYNYSPALIAVGGRKLMGLDGKAAARKLLGGASAGGKGAKKKPESIETSQDLVFRQSYENWVNTVSALILGREGMSADGAKSFLSQVMGRTDHYLSLLHNDTLGSLSHFLPQPPLFSAPQFFQDASANISSSTAGFSISSALINWAPCAVQLAPFGVLVDASGINVQPDGIVVIPQGVNVQPQGLNIQPTLIFIAPVGRNSLPQGANISPTLIAISPVGTQVNPHGKSCAATAISVDKDGNVTYNDPGGCDDEAAAPSSDSSGGGTTAGSASGR